MMDYENIKKIFKTIGEIAGAISLITGVAGVGFKVKDAFTEHNENKAKLIDAQVEEVSNEDSDISENTEAETTEE